LNSVVEGFLHGSNPASHGLIGDIKASVAEVLKQHPILAVFRLG
jgi:hypothetical protein